jgi:integrase
MIPTPTQVTPPKRRGSERRDNPRSPLDLAPATLQAVLDALAEREFTPNRRRDLRSAVTRVAKLLGDASARITLELPVLGARLAAISPIAVGLTPKSFSNIRSDLLAAVDASGLRPARSPAKALSPAWSELLAKLPKRREGIGLSRLARYASAQGITPQQVDDAGLAGFITAVREGSFHRQPNVLHRRTAQIWNEAAGRPGLQLRKVTVPSFRPAPKRIEWELLSDEFRRSVDDHLAWCSGSDVFAVDGRPRRLATRTLELRRGQIHAAVTALVAAGVEPSASTIKSLADFVTPAALKLILLQRYDAANGRANAYNRDLAEALVQIAREWVKVDTAVLAELKKLAARVPMPPAGLTDKNKRFLRQFDDPAVLQRLHQLPGLLWAEVRRQERPNFRTLAKAQVALALSILSYMPLRLQNLAALTFDVHLFVQAGPHAISSLEIPAAEVKNKSELAFDIPRHIVKMLIEYRDRIAPQIIGHRPERLFVNADGSPKSPSTVAWLIVNYAKRRAGIILTAHQFRHLCAKILLDAEPGSFETVKQALGHQNLKTTVGAYAGVDSRRAARHHQHLIEQTLAAGKLRHRAKPSRDNLKG